MYTTTPTKSHFDLLPFELQHHIIAHATHGHPTLVALNFSTAFPHLQPAVAAALSHHLTLSDQRRRSVVNRLAVSLCGLWTSVALPTPPYYSPFVLHEVLQHDAVQLVEVDDDERVWRGLARRAMALKAVRLVLRGKMPSSRVLQCLASVSAGIQSLTMVCCASIQASHTPCLVDDAVYLGPMGVRTVVKGLREFNVECGGREWWRPRGGSAACCHDVVDGVVVEGLAGGGRVRVEGTRLVDVAISFSKRVERVVAAGYMGGHELTRLAIGCGSLEWLACGVTEGEDHPVTGLLGGGLKGICLTWRKRRPVSASALYAHPASGLVRRIGVEGTCLEEVRLRRVKVQLGDLRIMLMAMGARLKLFEVSMMDQEQDPLGWVETVLRELTKWNYRLRSMFIYELENHERSVLGVADSVDERQFARTLAMARRLQRHAPYFDALSLRRALMVLVGGSMV